MSIRVENLGAMCTFYEKVVGLKLLRREESFVFIRDAQGYGGHTQNLALFDVGERTFLKAKSSALSPPTSRRSITLP